MYLASQASQSIQGLSGEFQPAHDPRRFRQNDGLKKS
jgi:hypothetical protein